MGKYDLLSQNEAHLLGAILKDPSLLDETTLQPRHMRDPRHYALFEAIHDLREEGQSISIFSLSQLGTTKNSAWGGPPYLSKLMESVPSLHSFKTYEKNIIEFYAVEQAQDAVQSFLEQTKETHSVKPLQKMIREVSNLEAITAKPAKSFKDQLMARMEDHYNSPETGLSGIDTGFKNMNELCDGLQPELIILGARPSMGKTALALQLMLQAVIKDHCKVTFFSLEMKGEQIIDRLIAHIAGIPVMKMRNPNKRFTPEDWEKYSKAVGILEDLDIDLQDQVNTVPEMRSALRRNMKAEPDKKHLAFIDFLTMIRATEIRNSRHNEVEEIVLDLKQIVNDFHVPIVVLAQLSRQLEQRNDKRPMMSDLRESGSIEQSADMVTFLYREDYYKSLPKHEQGKTELLVAKNRNGMTGKLLFKFIKEINSFKELT